MFFFRVQDFIKSFVDNEVRRSLDLSVASGKSILSVDYGTKKIGLAFADIVPGIAFPKDVLLGDWENLDSCFDVLLEKVEDFGATALVIGYPLQMNGELRENCIRVLAVVERIAVFFKSRGIDFPILLFDERFSTQAVYSNGFGDMNYFSNKSRSGKKCQKTERVNGTNFAKKKDFNSEKNNNGIFFDDDKSACLMLNEVLGLMS